MRKEIIVGLVIIVAITLGFCYKSFAWASMIRDSYNEFSGHGYSALMGITLY